LFRNSDIIHRGVPPRTASRLAIEVTLMPAFRRHVSPVFAGLNATYPEYPWSTTPLGRAAGDLLGSFIGPSRAQAEKKRDTPGRPAVFAQPAPAPAEKTATAGQTVRLADKEARKAEKAARAAEKATRGAEKQARAAEALRRTRRRQRLVRTLNAIVPPVALNIGGGPEFVQFRWLNLDGATGPANPSPFRFDAACRFPLRDRAIRTVYTSHCLEHLDDPTVERVLSEAARVLAPSGRLVVKIPDFDRALACWRAGDATFFDDDRWGLRRLTSLWTRRGVPDTLDARASMVFCGFWNDEYGDHFSARRQDERAYHGPAVVDSASLRHVIDTLSPHQISALLREHVVRHESSYHFNHQNAWSRDELRQLLEGAGFEIQSFSADDVIAAASDIPGITTALTESLYCLARSRRD
jgi:SAM-dependent methyltransferase